MALLPAIPHAVPIRCVDRLVEAGAESCEVEGIAPDAWEPWLIEGLAQTAAVMSAAAFREEGTGMLVQVRRFAISRPPRAGERLRFRIRIIRRLPPLNLVRGVVLGADGGVLADGELKLYLEVEP